MAPPTLLTLQPPIRKIESSQTTNFPILNNSQTSAPETQNGKYRYRNISSTYRTHLPQLTCSSLRCQEQLLLQCSTSQYLTKAFNIEND
ncbi:unnamed protein product [Caenorhabditis brenneri]